MKNRKILMQKGLKAFMRNRLRVIRVNLLRFLGLLKTLPAGPIFPSSFLAFSKPLAKPEEPTVS